MIQRYFRAPLVALLLLAAAPRFAQAQTGAVGIGTTAPDASAVLDITSTGKGLLPPRMTQAQRDAIASPATGLTVYNTTTNHLNTWNGSKWDEALSATQQPYQGPAVSFAYTGAPQTYTVPANVYSLQVDAAGASGGSGTIGSSPNVGGAGARVQAMLPVTPGQVLTVYVGGGGTYNDTFNGQAPGGYNGGGLSGNGGSGGGATDLRSGSAQLGDRLLVAGGGGGGGYLGIGSQGGAGGAPNGGNGTNNAATAGGGATQTAGGSNSVNSNMGKLGQGGNQTATGGGGGGGYYGGGAGAYGGYAGGGGGGGSSWVTPSGGSGITMTAGYKNGNGYLTITPGPAYTAPAISGVNFINVPGTWSVNGTNYYYNNGNVGIGTSSPAGQLANTAGNVIATDGNGISQQGLGWVNTSSAGYAGLFYNANNTVSGPGLAVKITSPAAAALDVSQGGSAGTAGTSLLRVQGTGQVGIGVASPTQTLDVNGGILARSTSAISQQGAYLQWNRTGGQGETWLLNQQGGGPGGIYFGKSDGSNNATEWARFDGNGNLGLGTTPGQKLDVNGNANVSGNSSVGGSLALRNSTTEKYNWSLTNGGLNLSESDVASGRLFVQDGGNVGIGTTSPIAKLHVSGSAQATPTGGNTSYFYGGSPLIGPQPPGGTTARATAAYFDGGQVWVNSTIVAGALNTTSDRRIKRVLGLSDRAADLALLNKLRITDYAYIDQHANAPGVIKKVIAQEVEEVLPTAVSRSTQALPNVYEKATKLSYAAGQLTVTTAKAHELPTQGGRMRFYTPTNESLDVDVTVVDAHTVRFASAQAYASGLFVYGKYVDDFRSVDYDALTTLNVSATQELARQVAELKAENATLKANAESIKNELQTVKVQATATLETFEARLRRLEAGGGQAQR